MHGSGRYADGRLGRTYYEVIGEGPTVVIARGGPGVGHSHFHPWFDRLADHCRVVFFDYLGTGRSDTLDDAAAYTIAAYAEQIETVRSAVGTESISVIGVSFGGMPALGYALAHSSRLDRLVLSNAQISAATWQQGNIDRVNLALRNQFPEHWRSIVAMRERGVRSLDAAYQELLGDVIDDLEWVDPYGHPPLEHDEHNGMRREVYEALVGDDPEWTVGGTMTSFDPDLASLRAPVLIVAGRWDRLTTPAIAEQTLRAMPEGGVEIRVFERSAHRPWVEEPDAYFKAVGTFLRQGVD